MKENHLQNMDLNKLNTMTLPNIIIYVFFQIDTSIDTIWNGLLLVWLNIKKELVINLQTFAALDKQHNSCTN